MRKRYYMWDMYKLTYRLDGMKITTENLNECSKKVGVSDYELLEMLDELVNNGYIYGDNEKIIYRIPTDTYKEVEQYWF